MKKLGLLILSGFTLMLSGCSGINVLDPKSSTGKEQAYLIWLSLGIMTLVLVVVFILFAYFVYKYRYSESRKGYEPVDVDGNRKLELTYTIIPIILLIILAVPTIRITMEQSPDTTASQTPEDDTIKIEVTGRQFEWEFKHENGAEVKDELVLPEDEDIEFNLHSEDLIHSFWIPELAGKVDVFPNKELTYIIRDVERGEYEGKCAEFCGVQHTNMTFSVKVISKEDYRNYINDLK